MLAIFVLGVLGLIVQSALLNILPARWVPDLGLLIPVVAILALPPVEGLLLAAALGISAGMFSNALLGQYALIRIVEFVVIRVLNAQLDLKRALPLAVFVFRHHDLRRSGCPRDHLALLWCVAYFPRRDW